MNWKGASRPRTLERAFQAVEKAQEEMRRREHVVLRNRGRLVRLQLCEEEEDGARPRCSEHRRVIALWIPTYSMEPWKEGLRKGVTDSSGAYLQDHIAVRRGLRGCGTG